MMRALAILCTMVLTAPAHAAPPPVGSEDAALMQGHKEWIESRHNQFGVSCCEAADGAPVQPDEMRVNAQGQTEVLYSKRHWPDGDGTWLVVPKHAEMQEMSPIYQTIVWIWRGHVMCVSRAGAF